MSLQSLWAQDAFFLGPLIQARLRDQVPELREVKVADEVTEPGVPVFKQWPNALIVLMRMTPGGAAGRRVTRVEQQWVVALGVTTARADADARNAKFGPLIAKVVRALQGWVPVGDQEGGLAFNWQAGPAPDYSRVDSYFPLLFSIQVVTA